MAKNRAKDGAKKATKSTQEFFPVKAVKKRIAEMYDMSNPFDQLAAAYMIAASAHAGKKRKNGRPYLVHAFTVAQSNTHSVTKEIIGVLHDVVEDSKWTFKDLREVGFPERVVLAIEAMTKREGELYFDFGERCSLNADARDKKIEDLTNNLDESDNNAFLSPTDVARINKYKLMRAYLVDIKKGKITAGSSIVDFAMNHPYFSQQQETLSVLQQFSKRAPVKANDDEKPVRGPAMMTARRSEFSAKASGETTATMGKNLSPLFFNNDSPSPAAMRAMRHC